MSNNPLDLFGPGPTMGAGLQQPKRTEVPAAPHLPQASPVGNSMVLNPVQFKKQQQQQQQNQVVQNQVQQNNNNNNFQKQVQQPQNQIQQGGASSSSSSTTNNSNTNSNVNNYNNPNSNPGPGPNIGGPGSNAQPININTIIQPHPHPLMNQGGPPGGGPGLSSLPPSTPFLQTPALTAHASLAYPGAGGAIDLSALGGSALNNQGPGPNNSFQMNQNSVVNFPYSNNITQPGPGGLPPGKTPFSDVLGWGWEVGSDVGSLPSVWSRASTQRSAGGASSLSGASFHGLSGDGQRLIYIKPQEIPSLTGGTVVIGLRKEIPEQFWNYVEILLVGGQEKQQLKLKPSGIRKGKKLAIKVPPQLEQRDYDVRVVFGGKILHGAIPLAVRGEDSDDSEKEDDD